LLNAEIKRLGLGYDGKRDQTNAVICRQHPGSVAAWIAGKRFKIPGYPLLWILKSLPSRPETRLDWGAEYMRRHKLCHEIWRLIAEYRGPRSPRG
jgi:hypothetical protein